MTIKWVKVDPLVMNGEPFCYGTRLTVRQLLELRRNGFGLTELIKDHPELRTVGIAAAYTYAADHRDRYAEFFDADGSLAGPGYSEDETEIKRILTTPFCPYAGSMIQQVKEQAESVVEHDVKVTLLAERWDPRDAGLMW